MTVLKLNDNGVWLLTAILSIIDIAFISNIYNNIIGILMLTPIILSTNLLIASNIKIIDIKKELAHRSKNEILFPFPISHYK